MFSTFCCDFTSRVQRCSALDGQKIPSLYSKAFLLSRLFPIVGNISLLNYVNAGSDIHVENGFYFHLFQKTNYDRTFLPNGLFLFAILMLSCTRVNILFYNVRVTPTWPVTSLYMVSHNNPTAHNKFWMTQSFQMHFGKPFNDNLCLFEYMDFRPTPNPKWGLLGVNRNSTIFLTCVKSDLKGRTNIFSRQIDLY